MTGRDRIVVMIILAAVTIGGAWMLVVAPKRDQAAKLSAQIQAEQSQLASAQAKVLEGERARQAFPAAYSELARLGEAVPADDSVPSLIYQLQSAAKASGLDFRSLQVSQSGTTGPGASTPAARSAATALPPGVAVGSAGFPTEQFTFSFQGDFLQMADFLDRVQRFVVVGNSDVLVGGRLLTVNAVTLTAGPLGFPQVAANISATTYLQPASQGVFNGATPSGPPGASSGPPGASSGPPGASSGPASATPGPASATPGPASATPGPASATPGPSSTPTPAAAIAGSLR